MSTNETNSDQWESVKGYKRLHWAAVVAFIIALLSPICLVVQWFVIIPVAGIILGILGFVTIKKMPEIYHGSNFSLIGIVVSIVMLSWSITGAIKSVEYYNDTAFNNAVQWLTYLKEDELPAAHQVTIGMEARQHNVQFLNTHYANNQGLYSDMLNAFTKSPINILLNTKDRWEPHDLQLVKNEGQWDLKKNKLRVTQHYHMPLNGSEEEVIAFRIQHYRVYDSAGRASQWQIESIIDTDELP